ncbi:MAG: DUF423 domain-containing protein [Armatimonadetes bacterium]|nr:DUF423 domain-containing protein [Armatimonadota bacterium]
MNAERTFTLTGAVAGCLAVALGAFAAHGLKARLDAAALETFRTGAQYQMYHALALFAVASVAARRPSRAATAAGWLFVAGMVLFSGSLYALALTGAKVLGAVTPFGGLCFLAGWAALAKAAWRQDG